MRTHGTHSCYVHGPGPGSSPKGCRCAPCRKANADYQRQRGARAAPPYVNATRARTHIANLATQGVGLKTVARLSGVSHGALTKLVYGDTARGRGPSKQVRPATEKAILGVEAYQADGAHRTHTADDYRALLDTLTERGWTKTAIANEVGTTVANLTPRTEQQHVTAARMAATRALLDRTPITRRNRWGTDSAEPSWTPEQDRRDRARRATSVEERARYRATANGVDDLPVIDLADLAQPWRARAACRLLPDDQTFIFWPGKGDNRTLAAAKAVCLTCTVAQDCLDWALINDEHGVWGGTSSKQRRDIRNGRAPAIAPQPQPRAVS